MCNAMMLASGVSTSLALFAMHDRLTLDFLECLLLASEASIGLYHELSLAGNQDTRA